MGYFRRPDAGALTELFVAAPVTERWRAQTVLTLPVFLALMLDRTPEAAPALVKAIKGGDPVKVEVVAQALNYSHLKDRRRLMESLVGESAAAGMDDSGADFLAFQPSHPVHVDMLWAAFFATGEIAYVDRVTALLSGWMPQSQLDNLLAVAARDEPSAKRAMAGVLAGAAQWSLTANGAEFPEIRDAIAVYAARCNGLASAMAAKILAELTGKAPGKE